MKSTHQTRNFLSFAILAIIAILLPMVSHAQTNQTWNGGSNTWDTGTTSDWSGGVWTGGFDNAHFSSTAGTITVDDSHGQVTANTLEFSSAGNWVVTGSTLEKNPWTTGQSGTFVQLDSGSGPVTISAPIELSDLGPNQQVFFTNNSNSALTVGSIDLGAFTLVPGNNTINASRRITFADNGGTSTITLDGTYTSTSSLGQGSLTFSEDGGSAASVYNIASSANLSAFATGGHGVTLQIFAGTLNIQNSSFVAGQNIALDGTPGAGQTINLVGAQTINAAGQTSMKNSGTKQSDGVSINGEATINQSTAAASTWAGGWVLDGTNITVGAVSGGRLTFSGNITGDSPLGLIKTGAGVVVLSSATGNGYDERDGNGNLNPLSTVAADIQQGTVLITNTSGSAFGIVSNGSAFYGNTGAHNNVVDIETGATLGGTGISARPVDAVAAGSIIAPGDPGQSNLSINPSIGTLHLTGGISAPTGVTLAFKLSFSTNDKLDLGTGAFTLGGPVTVDLTNLGAVSLGTNYLLASASGGLGAWSDTGATFTFEGLTDGLHVESFDFNTTADTFSIVVIPEPSTWMLMGLGALALFWRMRRKNVVA